MFNASKLVPWGCDCEQSIPVQAGGDLFCLDPGRKGELLLEDPGPDSSHFFDLLLGGDDDGGALHLDVKLLGLVLPAVEADLEFVVVILDTGMWKAL